MRNGVLITESVSQEGIWIHDGNRNEFITQSTLLDLVEISAKDPTALINWAIDKTIELKERA